MRKITLTIICALFAIAVLAQAPQGISHQAVIRDAGNQLVTDSPIGIKVSIIQTTPDGTVVYSETHTPVSNINGLITFVIGQGTSVDDFSEIDWASGPYFLKTEADPTGGTNYTIEGISQVLSVPYAIFAGKSGDQTWNKNANDIYYQNGNVGIGTNIPGAGLHLKGWAFPNSFMFLESGIGHDAGFRIYEGNDAKWHIFNQPFTGGLAILNAAFHPALFVKQADGNVGIGTTEPTALLHTQGTGQGEGNVLFTGFRKESGWGDPPVNGPGTRMMWYPDKAAFRVGHVFNNNWDRDSIGVFSMGMGSGSKAWGSVSTALGLETSAGHYSTAMGWATKALGNSSTAMGRESIASGDNSTAMGWSTTASGVLSTAMGYQTIASGKFSTAMGLGTKALSGYETVIGRWNAEYTPHDSLGWNDNDRLFVVGSGSSSTNRANAITILKNGNVGIGTTSPAQLMDINGNIRLSGGNRSLGTWSSHNLNLATNSTTRVTILSDGKVGIGTVAPTQKLDVNGNISLSGAHRSLGTWSAHSLNLTTNSTMRMMILSNGHVGIGTNNPSTPFDVRSSDNNTLAYFSNSYNSGSAGGQSSVHGYLGSGQQGLGYYVSGSRAPLKGTAAFGYEYTFGVAGYRDNDPYYRGGGVIGGSSYSLLPTWGSLGYKSSAGTHFGGYFTSSTTGSGKSPNEVMINCGIAAWGDLFGADIHGKIYGMFVEGGNYAIYSNGVTYKNNLDVHLQENGSNTFSVLYTSVSNEVTVQTSGVVALSNGKASIMFDPVFAATVSDKEPVIVTVTPIGNSNGVFLEAVSTKGFTVVENNNGKSNVSVNYIAVGRRAGYENPTLAPEVIDAEYLSKITRGLHNDGITETDGEGLYYENGKLVVGKHPSTIISEPKPAKHGLMRQQNLVE